MSLIRRCMGLHLIKKALINQKILKFKNPFTGEDIYCNLGSDHVGKRLRTKASVSHIYSKQYKKKNDFPLKKNGKPINWGLLLLAADLNERAVKNGLFGPFKRLTKRAVWLPTTFDRMNCDKWLVVMGDSIRAALKICIETDPKFKEGEPLLEFLEHMSGLFYGVRIAPKVKPENCRIYSMTDKIWEKQFKHLEYFEKVEGLTKKMLSSVQQMVHTSYAVCERIFQLNKEYGLSGYVSLFWWANRIVESNHSEIRGLGGDNGVWINGTKGTQRLISDFKM
eukprot:379869_1